MPDDLTSEPKPRSDFSNDPIWGRAPPSRHTSASLRAAQSDSRAALGRGPLPLGTRDQILLAVISGVALVCMGVYCVRTSHWGADPIELERQTERVLDYKIDLNAARWVEWSQMPGIGPVLANRIVAEREQNGAFRDVDDLARVKGIGLRRIEAIRPFIRMERPETAMQPAAAAAQLAGPPETP